MCFYLHFLINLTAARETLLSMGCNNRKQTKRCTLQIIGKKIAQHVFPPEGNVEGFSHFAALSESSCCSIMTGFVRTGRGRDRMHRYSHRQRLIYSVLFPEARYRVPCYSHHLQLNQAWIRVGVWSKPYKKYSFNMNAPGVKSALRERVEVIRPSDAW